MSTIPSRYLGAGLALIALVTMAAVLFLGPGAADAETVTITSDAMGKDGLLSGAIANASDGDTILMKGGFFYEKDLVVDKEVHIEGDTETYLVTTSVRVKADNVTIKHLVMTLDPGVMSLEGDNWTIEGVVLQECIGETCVRSVGTRGGALLNSTVIGVSQDAFQANYSLDLTIHDCYLYAPSVGLRINESIGLDIENIRVSQAYIGAFVSWSDQVTMVHSALDTKSYGMLVANTTNVTVDDSLLVSSGRFFGNYGIYIAYSSHVDIENCTFTTNAAGISAWESEDVDVRWNSIYGNLEGIWSVDSGLSMDENALFHNTRYNLNATGGAVPAEDNYWGTGSMSKATVNGDVDMDPLSTVDPTPDDPPTLVSKVPASHASSEDTVSEVIYDLGPHFSDDTWYHSIYMPTPSQLTFDVIYNSDPFNVTVDVEARSTCSGTCVIQEGQMRASTASNWYGEVELKVRAYDWRGKHVDSNSFKIWFQPENDRPTVWLLDTPKNTVIEMNRGDKQVFNITVYDDSPTSSIEVRMDDGEWEKVGADKACVPDNSSRKRELPMCAKEKYTFKVDDDLEVGKHTLDFRVCDGEYCSDEVYTGRYEVIIDNRGSEGRDLSVEGSSIAVVLVILTVLVAVAVKAGAKKD
jgi:parallel beta-helix repeat protein